MGLEQIKSLNSEKRKQVKEGKQILHLCYSFCLPSSLLAFLSSKFLSFILSNWAHMLRLQRRQEIGMQPQNHASSIVGEAGVINHKIARRYAP